MTFDTGPRIAGDRRRAAGTAGVLAFVFVVLAGLAVLLLARDGAGSGAAAAADGGRSASTVSSPGSSSDPGATTGAPAAAADTGVGAATHGTPADDAAVGGGSPAPAGEGPADVPEDGSAPVDPEMANVPEGVGPDPSGGGFVPPARRVTLPAGAEQLEEYPVKFPQTPEGAASAAVALTRYSATLNYLTASQVMRLYVSADHADAADGAAKAAVEAARTRLGVPLTGDPPLDASMVALPIGVQWAAEPAGEGAPERVRVSVLSVAEYRNAGELEREVVSVDSYLVWDGAAGDWRMVPPPADAPAGPGQAEIGTREFNDNGWAALIEEHP